MQREQREEREQRERQEQEEQLQQQEQRAEEDQLVSGKGSPAIVDRYGGYGSFAAAAYPPASAVSALSSRYCFPQSQGNSPTTGGTAVFIDDDFVDSSPAPTPPVAGAGCRGPAPPCHALPAA